jgi:hypothetical protein
MFVFEIGTGPERAGYKKERSQPLECDGDRSTILSAELGVNAKMRAADQGPSAIRSAAAERRQNSQHQNGQILLDQTISGIVPR